MGEVGGVFLALRWERRKTNQAAWKQNPSPNCEFLILKEDESFIELQQQDSVSVEVQEGKTI